MWRVVLPLSAIVACGQASGAKVPRPLAPSMGMAKQMNPDSNQDGITDLTEKENPDAKLPPPSPPPLHGASMVARGNVELMLYGGCVGQVGNSYTMRDSLWSYTLESNTWKEVQSQVHGRADQSNPSARMWHTAVVEKAPDGTRYMWVFGGDTKVGATNELWRYGFASKEWQQFGLGDVAPPKRSRHSASTDGAVLIVFGGFGGAPKQLLSDLWQYTFATDSWLELSALTASPSPAALMSMTNAPMARSDHSSVVANGKLFVFGGRQDGLKLYDIWEFDLGSNTWRDLTPQAATQQQSQNQKWPYGRCFHCAYTYEVQNGTGTDLKMGIFGGSAVYTMGDVWEFDLESFTMERRVPLGGKITPRTDMACAHAHADSAASSPGKVFVYGGRDDTTSGAHTYGDLWKYQVNDVKWAEVNKGKGEKSKDQEEKEEETGEELENGKRL